MRILFRLKILGARVVDRIVAAGEDAAEIKH